MEKAKSHWLNTFLPRNLVFPAMVRGAKVKVMFTSLLLNCRNEA